MSDVEDGSRHLPDYEQETYQLRERLEVMRAENERLRTIPERLIAMVEARAKWARDRVCPNSSRFMAYEAAADALETMTENMRAFMAAKDGEG